MKRIGSYIVQKVTSSAVGKVIRASFWGLLCLLGPGAVISTVGVTGVAVGAAVVHSGLIEYSAGKVVSKKLITT